MDFQERLQRAVQRGEQRRTQSARHQILEQLSEEESRALHAQARAELSDHIEHCLRHLADTFPGFEFQTVLSADGYGAKVRRDDLRARGGRPLVHEYSHLELLVRSYSNSRILEVVGRGTVANKEVLNRSAYQFLNQLDLETLKQQVDQWVLDYAERFAAAG
jgi:hypothetical protein|uniref:Uncharacterized protein n=1 Tax=Schlesneria paludicola TaxID=360056 RepID=A0A7C4LLK2_9PLAN